MSVERDSFVALCSECGALLGATVDTPARKKENAKHVADWIRRGERVERMTTQAVREFEPWGHRDTCSLKPKRRPRVTQGSLPLEGAVPAAGGTGSPES